MNPRREKNATAAMRLSASRVCILMVCTDMGEADQVGRQLSELNNGFLITYRRAEDLMLNAPVGKVALVILATKENSPAGLSRTLKWLKNRWPGCPVTVVGTQGGGKEELAARSGGAFFLTRPVDPQQWSALLDHVLGANRQPVAKPGGP